MSIDLNWEALTSGPDGEALAESIRCFIHDKFQSVPLPRFIKSVTVHGFDFGTIPPELGLKDITDPLPDFYEQELGDDESDDDHSDVEPALARERAGMAGGHRRRPSRLKDAIRHEFAGHDLGSPFLGTSTPGLLSGPGLSYLHGHLGTGSHTPLAAVAGAHLGNAWPGAAGLEHHNYHHHHHLDEFAPTHSRNPSQSSISVDNFPPSLPSSLPSSSHGLREKSSVSTLAPTSLGNSRPPTRDMQGESAVIDDGYDEEGNHGVLPGQQQQQQNGEDPNAPPPRPREPRVDDVQAVFRIQYAGDIRLNLTAEILLDYPMPSFVGIPLKLNITGLSFDGVGVLAHIRKRVNFCFLSPEDAMTAVGADEPQASEGGEQSGGGQSSSSSSSKNKTRFGGLLQEIRVESEIGDRDGGKQSLKNVGKVEKFVLEQVRRIFEEEFVYPSFWTFLV
jgi:hypothetical protein